MKLKVTEIKTLGPALLINNCTFHELCIVLARVLQEGRRHRSRAERRTILVGRVSAVN